MNYERLATSNVRHSWIETLNWLGRLVRTIIQKTIQSHYYLALLFNYRALLLVLIEKGSPVQFL